MNTLVERAIQVLAGVLTIVVYSLVLLDRFGVLFGPAAALVGQYRTLLFLIGLAAALIFATLIVVEGRGRTIPSVGAMAILAAAAVMAFLLGSAQGTTGTPGTQSDSIRTSGIDFDQTSVRRVVTMPGPYTATDSISVVTLP